MSIWDFSSPTGAGTRIPCNGSLESWPLDHQGSSIISSLLMPRGPAAATDSDSPFLPALSLSVSSALFPVTSSQFLGFSIKGLVSDRHWKPVNGFLSILQLTGPLDDSKRLWARACPWYLVPCLAQAGCSAAA